MSVNPANSSPPSANPSGATPSKLGRWDRLLEAFPWAAWLTSGLVHGGFFLGLSLLLLASPKDHLLWLTSASDGPALDEMSVDEAKIDDVPVPGIESEASLGDVAQGEGIELPGPITGTVGNVRTGPTNAGSVSVGGAGPTIEPEAPVGDLVRGDIGGALEVLTNPLGTHGGGLEGRKFENRLEAALAGGGTQQSEAAVERGLAWLAEHQFPDGGWRFDLTIHPQCQGACRDSGTFGSTTSATGLALLSFLGAGYTHKTGKYEEVVTHGLYYLSNHMTVTPQGGDFRDNGAELNAMLDRGVRGGRGPGSGRDTMYSHGIATVAITEAYAMTHDAALRETAEQAVKFIINAQYDDGGWRYNPKWETNGPGDMTVTGWQLAALKSALLAGIDVPYDVWIRASKFIDGLQIEGGAGYTYLAGENRTEATSAIGLLCRMIGGWPREKKALQKGAAHIADQSPQNSNVYFIYYGSQVLHHLGGSRWDKWNPKVREYLIKSQATDGHENGSWYFEESHSRTGGRLYTTTVAIMTLEVYYRYMPLYGEPFVGRAP